MRRIGVVRGVFQIQMPKEATDGVGTIVVGLCFGFSNGGFLRVSSSE